MELGRLERPTAEQFQGSRKLLLVPLLLAPPQPPEGLAPLLLRYWEQVRQQVDNLTRRLGSPGHVYHEGLHQGGDPDLAVLEKFNPLVVPLVRAWCGAGARMEATDDWALTEEVMDWQRCLLIGLMSQKVTRLVQDNYEDASRRRYDHIARRIDETLKSQELGILLIGEDHRVQFPSDIQVFYVAPPALDEVHRWLRDRRAEAARAQESREQQASRGDAETMPPQDQGEQPDLAGA
ncbi:MAG: hypothetical protein HYY00_04905 [Chloroflexi bacterium]|nr:hypothetical protein [Chloroflexota bacterium]